MFGQVFPRWEWTFALLLVSVIKFQVDNAHSLVLATSVDAERAFSTGRRQVSHLQHNMNSQTFKARMAVGSWARTPLLSNFTTISDTILASMGKPKSG